MTQFSNTLQNNGLIQQCEFKIFGDNGLTQISSDTDRLQMFTNFINEGIDKYTTKVITLDGTWQVADSNYTDYGIATTSIVSGQSDYPFNSNFLNVLSIEMKQPDGTWVVLDNVDEVEFARLKKSMTQTYVTNGTPIAVNLSENSLFLLSAPNYNMSAGIKVKYQRPFSYFVYGDTGKEPGIPRVHHGYLVDYACSQYASLRTLNNAVALNNAVIKWETETIPQLFLVREKLTRKRLEVDYQDNK